MPHQHQRHATEGHHADNQKRQVIAHRDFRYWLERRRPRVSIHESTPAVPAGTGNAGDGDEGHH